MVKKLLVGAYPRGVPNATALLASSTARKCSNGVEVTDSDKHSSLLRFEIHYDRKKF